MIKFDNVTKRLKKRTVISNLNLEILNGNLVALIGASGCGKTTFLKMINRLIQPSKGRIFINDKNIAEMDVIKLRRSMGYVIQQTGLFPHMNVRKNIEIISRAERRAAAEITTRTMELMDMVGLKADEFLNRYPRELSGGQQQRVGVARAFATNPDIILMDEPFSALDPITRANLQDELVDLHDKTKKTIVFVTHDMNEAIKIADMICIMDEGQVLQYDTPENILKNPCNDFVANFVGKNRIWASPEFIKVHDIMIEEPVTCRTSASLLQAVEKMRAWDVDSLMVVDQKTCKLLGIVRAKEVQQQKDRMQMVITVMKDPAFTVKPDDSLVDIVRLVDEQDVGNIPVLSENGILVGLITRSSLVTTLSQSILEKEEGDAI